jgi:hypothetical protein
LSSSARLLLVRLTGAQLRQVADQFGALRLKLADAAQDRCRLVCQRAQVDRAPDLHCKACHAFL